MSLILDALRKSEAERQRGKAPDLFANVTLAPLPRRTGPLRFWPVLGLAGLVLGAGFVIWRGQQSSSSALDNTPSTDVFADQGSPDAMPDGAAPGGTEQGDGGQANSQAGPGNVPTTGTAKTPNPSNADARLTSANGAEIAPTSARPANNAATAASAVASSPKPVGPALPIPASADLSMPAPTPRDDGGGLESLPPIAVLSASERASLPPLKLSMHVFGNEPAKRFAIIDGQRVTEGSSLGGSIIEEIRRDGVVLNINGRRVLLPRP